MTPDELKKIEHLHAAGLSVQGDVGRLLSHIEGEQSRIDAAVARERERIRGAILSAIICLPMREEADGYEFVDDAGTTLHTPTADERAMLEDFGHGLIGSLYTNLCIAGVLPTSTLVEPTPAPEEGR